MNLTRRTACLLIPLAGLSVPSFSESALPSSTHRFEDLPTSKEGAATYRDILEGTTHTGDYLEVHETDGWWNQCSTAE